MATALFQHYVAHSTSRNDDFSCLEICLSCKRLSLRVNKQLSQVVVHLVNLTFHMLFTFAISFGSFGTIE